MNRCFCWNLPHCAIDLWFIILVKCYIICSIDAGCHLGCFWSVPYKALEQSLQFVSNAVHIHESFTVFFQPSMGNSFKSTVSLHHNFYNNTNFNQNTVFIAQTHCFVYYNVVICLVALVVMATFALGTVLSE